MLSFLSILTTSGSLFVIYTRRRINLRTICGSQLRGLVTCQLGSAIKTVDGVVKARRVARGCGADLPRSLVVRSLKCLCFREIRDRAGLSRSTMWRLEHESYFRKHRRICSNAVGWLVREIDEWMIAITQCGWDLCARCLVKSSAGARRRVVRRECSALRRRTTY